MSNCAINSYLILMFGQVHAQAYTLFNLFYLYFLIEKRIDSDGGSKDSSLDSGTEIKAYSESRREIINVTKMTTRVENRRGIMTDDSAIGDVELTAHDADIDSDVEYRHRALYYPAQSGSLRY